MITDRFTHTEADAGSIAYATADYDDTRPTSAELVAEELNERDLRDDMVRCPRGCAVWFHAPDTEAARRHRRVVHDNAPHAVCGSCGLTWSPFPAESRDAARAHVRDTGHRVHIESVPSWDAACVREVSA